nr:retrovirus-related Pol polyprotein from transposon TNT 1-94 [Tanacetum cinerariifolium]
QQYPHNLLQPLSLIPDNRGRCVIPFAHFINNDLEYLRGGASSQKYTTSMTKTKAADYGHIKWIEDLFYGFAVNQESTLDVYSKRRIIAVTDLKIVEWHNYKHLDWISRRMEDLQLGIESYQKRLNLTKPDTYRSDLKQREAYTAYSNPRGFVYQNKDKKKRLMQIDELHKFSDGTLNDVRNALDDHLKGIRMQYLPQTIWRKGDKDRAAAMIQAIDKMLKTRRIMRSLKRFVGGQLLSHSELVDIEKEALSSSLRSPKIKYVLVVVNDYSRYTWVFFLHSKDEASDVIISFIKKTQVNLQLQVQRIRTDNGTEFKNKTLAKFFDEVGITQQFSSARTPQQNAIATACFTQNHLIIHKRFDKTLYELINRRKLNIKFFRVFGCRGYLLNDYEDVGKLKEKANPNEHHVLAIKRIFRYLKGTINLGLWYPKHFGFDLTGYSDADHAGCHLDQESASGSDQFLGDKLVCWSSKKQNCVSISTAKSEYVAVSSCSAQVLWMRTQLTDYGFFYDKVPIYCDSKSAIAISCNPVHHTRTKHIDVRYHFIKDHVEKGTIELYFVGTEYQLTDLFTKSLSDARFKFLVEKLGMMSRET